jgi:hypothetical protein
MTYRSFVASSPARRPPDAASRCLCALPVTALDRDVERVQLVGARKLFLRNGEAGDRI